MGKIDKIIYPSEQGQSDSKLPFYLSRKKEGFLIGFQVLVIVMSGKNKGSDINSNKKVFLGLLFSGH